MDNFVVSARKYRPVTFDTVVGQRSITDTLKNAIRNQQLAQAFLFCGPRGVGKTTCARILAKVINCEKPSANIEPCNECVSCKSFNESASFNIHELDAASNNSVEDIRNLVDQVRIPPQMGRYKVYIIDEVHMLSASAFNAFLKTLEEPPSYAKFILATTEKHKIIPTILSRCQIFDFKRITINDISSHLEFVALSEGVNADPEALHLIAQKADGALRDALTIFDQMVNLGDRRITREQVVENLNVLDYDYYFTIVDAIQAGDYKKVLLIINEVIEKGFDGQHFITGFGEHLRNLLMCKDPVTVKLLEAAESVKNKYLEQARAVPLSNLISYLDINNKNDINYRGSNFKKLSIEVSLVQMCQLAKPAVEISPATAPEKKTDLESVTVKSAVATPSPASDSQPVANNPVTEPSVLPVTEEKPAEYSTVSATAPANPELPAPVSEESLSQEALSGRTTGSVTTGFSLKDSLQTVTTLSKKPNGVQDAPLAKEPFTAVAAEKALQLYAGHIQGDSALLFTALTSYLPEVNDSHEIILKVGNAILEKEVNDNWTAITSFLKKELNNDFIHIILLVEEVQAEAKRFLSDKEKFDAMMEKNPMVRALKDQLNLELDNN